MLAVDVDNLSIAVDEWQRRHLSCHKHVQSFNQWRCWCRLDNHNS